MKQVRILAILISFLWPQAGIGQYFSEVGNTIGVNHEVQLNVLMGGGVAIFDYNNDGNEDLYLTGGDGQDRLFKNNGNGIFTDVSVLADIVFTANLTTEGVAAGDINNDGYRDLFVTTSKNEPNILLLNNGDGTFSDISLQAGITHESWSMSVSFGDFNLDGYLDIYVTNFLIEQGFIYDNNNQIIGFDPDCYPNFLYVNQGDNTFIEQANDYGVANLGCGLATAFTDVDNDNDVDILIANDFGPFHISTTMYENEFPTNRFFDNTESANFVSDIYGMGIAIGDIDNDLNNDYYITNLGRNVLFYANGDGTFTDLSTIAGVEDDSVNGKFATGWGTMFMDYDNDGYVDLYVNNGQIPSGLSFTQNATDNPNRLFKNNGNSSFTDVTDLAGVANGLMGRGSAYFDFDNDGDLDIVSAVIKRDPSGTQRVDFFQNNLSNGNHWLKVKLAGIYSNRDAIGSKILAYSPTGNRLREIDGGSSHLSQNSTIAHFGLGGNPTVDSLMIKWSAGINNLVYNIPTDTLITIEEEGTEVEVTTVNCNEQPSIITLTNTKSGGAYSLYDLNNQTIVGTEKISDGTPLTLSTGIVSEALNYQVRTNQNGLIIALDTIIHKKITPVQPKITVDETNLSTMAGISYKWFLNGDQISTERNIVAEVSGIYSVEVVDYYGCIASSEPVEMIIAGIDANRQQLTSAYPNPSTGLFEVNDLRLDDKSVYFLMDLRGNIIYPNKMEYSNGKLFVDMRNLESGIYLMRLEFQGGITSTTVMVKSE